MAAMCKLLSFVTLIWPQSGVDSLLLGDNQVSPQWATIDSNSCGFLGAKVVNTSQITSSDVRFKEKLARGTREYCRYQRRVPLKTKGSCMCSMIGMETGSRSYPKCRTAVRIHKSFRVSALYVNFQNSLVIQTQDFQFPGSFIIILCTSSVVMVPSIPGQTCMQAEE